MYTQVTNVVHPTNAELQIFFAISRYTFKTPNSELQTPNFFAVLLRPLNTTSLHEKIVFPFIDHCFVLEFLLQRI